MDVSSIANKPTSNGNGRIAWSGGPAEKQNFSISDNIIYYMTKNPSSPQVYLKLAMSCKYFFEKKPLLIVARIEGGTFCSDKDGDECANITAKCCVEIDLSKLSSKIWLTHRYYYFTAAPTVNALLPQKLYKCENAELRCFAQTIPFEDFKLIASSFEKFYLRCVHMVHKDGSTVQLEEILGSLLNVREFNFYGRPVVTASTMKKICQLHNLSNLRKFTLDSVPQLGDVKDFENFIMKHKDTRILLQFRDIYPFTVKKTPSIKNIDFLMIDIFFVAFSFSLVVSYIPPDVKSDTVRDFCETLIALKSNSSFDFLLVGDFNMPEIDWENHTGVSLKEKIFIDFLSESGLRNSVLVTTRNNNILDLVLSSFPNLISNITTDPGFAGSDHDIVNFSLKCNHTPPPKPSNSFKNFIKADYLAMNYFFFEQKWEFLNQQNLDLNVAYKKFSEIINSAISIFVKTISPSSEDYFSPKIKATIEYQKSIPKTAENFSKISLISKKIAKLAVKEKREKEKTILEKHGIKGIFNHLGKYIKNDNFIPAISTETKILFSETEKTAEFGQTFLNNFHAEKSSYFEDCFPVRDSNLPLLTVEQVKEFLQKLKPKCNTSPDGIPYIVLKKCFSTLAKPITKIINLSFLQSNVPEIWKIAHVIPVFKKGDKHLASNYRPISLNCSLSMIPQKIVIDFLDDFFTKNNLIPSCQHGFTKSKSVTTQMIETFDFITDKAEKNITIDLIYFDVKKAFDRMKHFLLYQKLKKANVPNSIIAWIQAFLSNRKFRVKIGETLSDFFNANSGVPQGSKLGPILFLFFVADLISYCETPEVVTKLFADDLKALSAELSFTNPPLQVFLGKLENWMKENELEIATEKCNVLHCLPNKNPRISYYLNGQKISTDQTSIKDLGLIVSENLSWETHIKTISKNALTRLFILFKALKSNSPKLLLHMYQTYVRPLVEFSTPVFNPTQVKLIEKLEKVQKVAVKLIFLRSEKLRPYFNAPYEEKLEMLNIESLETRRHKFDLIFLNDYLTGKINCELNLSVRDSITRGSTRKIELPNSKKDIKRNFFTFRASSSYIKLPRHLQYTNSKPFKRDIMALKV